MSLFLGTHTHTNIIPFKPVIYTYEKRVGFPAHFFTQLEKSEEHYVLISYTELHLNQTNCAAFHRIHNRSFNYFGHFIYWILYTIWVKFHLCLQISSAFTAQIFMKLATAEWHYAYIFFTEFHLNPSRPMERVRGNTFMPLVWTPVSWFLQNPHLPDYILQRTPIPNFIKIWLKVYLLILGYIWTGRHGLHIRHSFFTLYKCQKITPWYKRSPLFTSDPCQVIDFHHRKADISIGYVVK